MAHILAIDQGTTSTRCALVDQDANLKLQQREHRQIHPQPGWVEHDPLEIWNSTRQVIADCLSQHGTGQIAAVALTNQRETTLIWDRRTGRPFYNAIVWQDTRIRHACEQYAADSFSPVVTQKTGLPIATYFSAPKIRWILDHVDLARDAAAQGHALAGTIDSWLIWNLTGGPNGGRHLTDVTNASRTLLMNLRTLDWDDELLEFFNIPRSLLPRINPSSDPAAYGLTDPAGPIGASVPIAANLGDQQAALVGQCCFAPGEIKNTYGTGCFLLMNTGTTPVVSTRGLLTTVGYQFAGRPPVYALEGSIAVAGAAIQWLRDNLGIITQSAQVESLAAGVADNGGVYFVPAFSGLFAPYWRSDARGIIVGLSAHSTKAHIARAALESTAFQTLDVLSAMRQDCPITLQSLKADGGMSANGLLMQFQADLLDIPVVRCQSAETTTLGAAFAAGLAVGFWQDEDALPQTWRIDRSWRPTMSPSTRQRLHGQWQKAVERSLRWLSADEAQ
jgi:glycerol kinase